MKCIFRGHAYVETDRYLMFTGEDRVFYECSKCEKEKEEYTLETFSGKAKALNYNQWYEAKLKQIKAQFNSKE